jgi:hypothetical protein
MAANNERKEGTFGDFFECSGNTNAFILILINQSI